METSARVKHLYIFSALEGMSKRPPHLLQTAHETMDRRGGLTQFYRHKYFYTVFGLFFLFLFFLLTTRKVSPQVSFVRRHQ